MSLWTDSETAAPPALNGSDDMARHAREDLHLLAYRLRRAVNGGDGVIRLDWCLQIADKLDNFADSFPLSDQRLLPDPERLQEIFGLNSSAATVLEILLRTPGTTVTFQEFAEKGGYRKSSLKVIICHLRRSLEVHGLNDVVKSVRATGYRLTKAGAEEIAHPRHRSARRQA